MTPEGLELSRRGLELTRALACNGFLSVSAYIASFLLNPDRILGSLQAISWLGSDVIEAIPLNAVRRFPARSLDYLEAWTYDRIDFSPLFDLAVRNIWPKEDAGKI